MSRVRVAEDDPARPWYEPGVWRVAPDVHRIPLPIPEDGLRAVNAYVLTDGHDVAVIDPGPGVEETQAALDAALAALDLAPHDVTHALITHVHYDHYTHAVARRERQPLTVWLGEHERASLDLLRVEQRALPAQARQLRRYGDLELAAFAAARRTDGRIDDLLREGPDRWLADRRPVPISPALEVLHTPGHTRGHVVFRDDGRAILFAGDHVLPSITPSIGFEAEPPPLPLVDYLASLHAVRVLADTRLLPAHGPVTASVHARVDELLDHHDDRLASAVAAVGDGAASGLDVAHVLRWTRGGRRLDELDRFNRMLAVIETGYHLDLLVERGTLRIAIDDDGVARYRT